MSVKILLCTLLIGQAVVYGAYEARQKLARTLLAEYVKGVAPDSTPVTISLSYLCANYDFDTNILTSRVWESLFWQDKRLEWDPKEYAGIEQLRIPSTDIWTPDIRVFESVDSIETRDPVNALLFPDGTVMLIPMVDYRTRCDGTTEDSINCTFKLGSWTYNNAQLVLEEDNVPIDMSKYQDTCPFTLVQQSLQVSTETYPCCPGEEYAFAEVKVQLQPRDY